MADDQCGLVCGCVEAVAAREAIRVVFDTLVLPAPGCDFIEPEVGHKSLPREVMGILFLKRWSARIASEAYKAELNVKRTQKVKAKEAAHA